MLTRSTKHNESALPAFTLDTSTLRQDQFQWRIPRNGIDAHTTNCLLNSYANVIHKEQYGYHPYAFEMAKLVREGYLDRSEALKKLEQPEDLATVLSVKNRLN